MLVILAAASSCGLNEAALRQRDGRAEADSTAEVATPLSRVFPPFERWLVPGPDNVYWYKQLFRAEMAGPEGSRLSAEWSVKGPGHGTWEASVFREDGKFCSAIRISLGMPGDYAVACAFTDEAGNRSVTSWAVTVGTGPDSVHGRVVAPSEAGRLVFLKGGAVSMGSPAAKDARPGVLPARQVEVKDFYIGKYPVTASGFCAFLNAIGAPKGAYVWDDDSVSQGPRFPTRLYRSQPYPLT